MFVILFIRLFFLALQQEVAETEAQEDMALHLPPCNAAADRPENVYLFDDSILHIPLLCVNEGMQELQMGGKDIVVWANTCLFLP